MNSFLNQTATRWAGMVIRWRFLMIALTVLLTAALGSGAAKLSFSNDYRAFFSGENPHLLAFEKFQSTYTKNDNILIVIQAADGHVLSPKTATVIEQLTEKAWQTPFATRVDSISNFQYSHGEEDDLIVEDLVKNAPSLSAERLQQKLNIALSEPLLLNSLISPSAQTTGINITLRYPGKSLAEVPQAVAYVRAQIAELNTQHPDLTFALSGISMLNNAFSEAGQQDAETLTPIMYLLLLVLIYISLRSFSGTLGTLLVIAFSTVAAMGIAGHIGIQLTPISITAPTIILTLAIADSIHLLLSFKAARRENMDKHQAIKESIRINFIPITITSLTTIVGFLTLNMSDAPPFGDLGNITAFGIAGAWLLSLTLLPAVLAVLPSKQPSRLASEKVSTGLSAQMGKLADVITGHYQKAIVAVVVFTAICVSLLPTIQINDEFVKYFDDRVEFRRDADFAMANLTGVYILEYDIHGQSEGGISEPEYLNNLAKFTDWLNQQPEVVHVYSYSDIIKRLNKNLHADLLSNNNDWYTIPTNRELAAQYLLLYEMSLPFGLDLSDRINIDKSATRLTVTIDNLPTNKIQAFIQRSEQWLKDSTPTYMNSQATGAVVMFSHIFQRNAESMLKGNVIAVLVISLIMIVTLRSVKYGLISLIPNTIPLVITFGVWALLVGKVGVAAATVTSTSLGIIVDNTVHFLSKYLRARREKGLNQPDAIRYAFTTVGEAIVITTVILGTGFSVLAFSTFMINAQMGLLTALAIVVALVVDFVLLPALLMVGYKKEPIQNLNQTSDQTQSMPVQQGV